MNGTTPTMTPRSIPQPLQTATDMRASWQDVELDFDTAAQRIIDAHRSDGEQRDLPIADLKTWAVAPYEGQLALVPLARHHTPKPLRANAFGNLAARVGAPAEFLRRLPAPLQLATLNYLLMGHTESAPATLRLRGEEVSAIVSDRYAPLDPSDLVDTLRSALVKHGMLSEVRVRGVASGMVDNLRLIFPAEARAIKPGDVSALGIDITASSFARSAIHVSPVVWRLVCSNGLKQAERGTGFSFRHVGDAQRLRDAVSEAIPSAVVRARGVMDQWQRAVAFMIDDVHQQIESLRELTAPEKRAVEDALTRDLGRDALPERTDLYSLVNALTASAKAGPPSRRLELESLAGSVLAHHVGGGAR